MAYDPETLLQRYQQLLDPAQLDSESNQGEGCAGGLPHATEGCASGMCESCCVGVVEMVRQYSEQAASLETRSYELDDIVTKAGKLEP
jgi:hypothetical protein